MEAGASETQPEPGPSTTIFSPVKKRPRKSLSASEKLMVMNAYKHTFLAWPKDEHWSLMECAKKTADILRISAVSVRRIVSENKGSDEFSSPRKTGPKETFVNKYDEFTFHAVRQIVHRFFQDNEIPTLVKVLQVVNDEVDIPNMSKSTLRKVLKHLNFKYATRKRHSMLIEWQDIVLWRRNYLISLKEHRRNGKFIYYQDETWINEGHTVKKTWVDTEIKSSRQAFLEGLTMGLKAPTGKGRRLIISHIGSEEGFLEGGLLMFESKSNNDDYHQDMNAQCFEQWVETILPKLKNNSVLFIDNAPYHSRKCEKIPNIAWRKGNIQEWLSSKNIVYDHSYIIYIIYMYYTFIICKQNGLVVRKTTKLFCNFYFRKYLT